MSAGQDIEVSVLVTTYNHEKYVKQSIDSILDQEADFKFEVLIGDDASTDHTQKILKDNYGTIENARLFLRKKNTGGGKNGTYLQEQARGKYIFWMNGDDYWLGSDVLQTFRDFLENHKEYIGIAGRRYILSERTGKKWPTYSIQDCNKELSLNDLLDNKLFDSCATMFVNFFHDGKYDYKTYHYSRAIGDLTYATWILLHGNLYQTDQIIGVYRTDRRGRTSSYNGTRTAEQVYMDHVELIRNLERRMPVKLDYSKLEGRYAEVYIKSAVSIEEKMRASLRVFWYSGIGVLLKCRKAI